MGLLNCPACGQEMNDVNVHLMGRVNGIPVYSCALEVMIYE